MARMQKQGYFCVVLSLGLLGGAVAALGQSAAMGGTMGGNVLRGGDFEDQPAMLAWDQSSTTNDSLIVQVGSDQAHGGSWIARLGGTPKTTDALEQPIGALDQYAQSATLSFYWRVENPRPGESNADVLQVDLVDQDSGQIVSLTTLAGNGVAGWQYVSLPFSPEDLGLYATSDYLLQFEADIRSASSPTAFDLDDVSLAFAPSSSTSSTSGPVAELMPVGDPTLPPPVVDSDGDMQLVSTAGCSVTVVGTTAYHHNSDLPNTSSPDFPAHQQITLTAAGFTKGVLSTSNIKVKFEVQGTQATSMLSPSITSLGNGSYTIVGTVPNSPQPGLLSTGLIKIKNTSTGEVGWSGTKSNPYSISSTGVETGFRWGFPDRIGASPSIGAGATTCVLGGGPFRITVPGLHVFKKPSGAAYYPTLFAKDSSTPALKVKVDSNGFTQSGTTWTSTWKSDGAPVVCTATTPCIATNTALELDLLNADNEVTDSTDHNYPSAIYATLKVAVPNAITFTPPTQAPSVTNAIPNVAYSVGPGAIMGSCSASTSDNLVQFEGSGITRIVEIDTLGSATPWTNLAAASSPYVIQADATGYKSGSATVKFITADNLTGGLSGGLTFSYQCSWKSPYLSPCLVLPANNTYPVVSTGASGFNPVWTFLTGYGEPATVQMTVEAGDTTMVTATPIVNSSDDSVKWIRTNTLGFSVWVNSEAGAGAFVQYHLVISSCAGMLWTGDPIFQYEP